METIETHLNKFGNPGDTSRLKEIAQLNLGLRSEAAARALKSREINLSQSLKLKRR